MNWKDLDISDCLFRYRSFDKDGKSINALKEKRLYFSSPAWFNDPYDSLVFSRADKTWKEISRNIVNNMDQCLDISKQYNPKETFFAYQLWKTSPELSLRLTYEVFHNGLRLVRNMIRNNTKVICFSESYDSMLMWAHYADYHKGFALMYKKGEIQNSGVFSYDGERIGNSVRIEPVAYVEKQLDLTNEVGWYVRENITPKSSIYKPVDRSVGVTKIRRVLLEKSKDWSYEEEWRVTERCLKIDVKSKAHYIDCLPKAILVGSKCEQPNHEKLISIAKELKIPIFRMYLSENVNGFVLSPENGDSFYCF